MSQINETQNHLLEQGVFNCTQAEAQAYWGQLSIEQCTSNFS